MRRPKPRQLSIRSTTGATPRTRCTRTQPSVRRATRAGPRDLSTPTARARRPAVADAVQPLRSLGNWARSIFDAARVLVDEGVELVEP
jgi:hypothetical protein